MNEAGGTGGTAGESGEPGPGEYGVVEKPGLEQAEASESAVE